MTTVNTRFLENEYDYVKPDTLTDALDILISSPNVKIFAGGTDLIVKLKAGADIAMDTMLDINGIAELKEVSVCAKGNLHIGAGAVLSGLEKDARITEGYPALSEAIKAMASVSIRNIATIGGNVCNASPVADTLGPILCYGGIFELMSKFGLRSVRAEDFFKGPGITEMRPNEMLTKIKLIKSDENSGWAFIKIGRVKADIAKISLTVVLTRSGSHVTSCRMAMGSVAATPLYLAEISESLCGKELTRGLIEEIAAQISAFIKPIDDNRTTAEYRTDIAKVIAEEAILTAWERSGGKIE